MTYILILQVCGKMSTQEELGQQDGESNDGVEFTEFFDDIAEESCRRRRVRKVLEGFTEQDKALRCPFIYPEGVMYNSNLSDEMVTDNNPAPTRIRCTMASKTGVCFHHRQLFNNCEYEYPYIEKVDVNNMKNLLSQLSATPKALSIVAENIFNVIKVSDILLCQLYCS